MPNTGTSGIARRAHASDTVLWFSQRLRKGPTALPAFFSELDCAIASTGDRAKNFALKNQVYCEFSNSVACQVLIKQRALEKKRIRNLLSSEFFATFRKSTITQRFSAAPYECVGLLLELPAEPTRCFFFSLLFYASTSRPLEPRIGTFFSFLWMGLYSRSSHALRHK